MKSNEFNAGQKYILVNNEKQCFYPQQIVTFIGLASWPNQGTAILFTNDFKYIIVLAEFLKNLDDNETGTTQLPSIA